MATGPVFLKFVLTQVRHFEYDCQRGTYKLNLTLKSTILQCGYQRANFQLNFI